MSFHPYYLKQYNNQRFLFTLDENTNSISNLALDIIIEIKEPDKAYIENETIDFEEYSYAVVSVTVIHSQYKNKSRKSI